MKHKITKYTIFSLLFICISQNAISGSILSSRGIGSYSYFGNVRSMGMGGIGIGLNSYLRISRLNPAGLYKLNTTRISLKFLSDLTTFEDTNYSSSSSYSNFDGFSFAVPLGSGLSMMMGLTPLTRMDFLLSSDHEVNEEKYTKSIDGDGGLNQFSLSLSWAVHQTLALGIKSSYNFGKITETWLVDYQNPAMATSRDVYSITTKGVSFSFGLMFHPTDRLEIGAAYTPSSKLKNSADLYTIFATVKEVNDGYLTLPSSYGIGVSYRLNSSLLVGVDYIARDWTELKMHDKTISNAVPTKKIGIGAELFSSHNLMDPYWKRIAYRIGISYQPYYHNDIRGNTIKERWLTLGLGLPAFLGMSHVDLSVAIGQRGDVDLNDISETIIRIGASITGGEKWFLRRY